MRRWTAARRTAGETRGGIGRDRSGPWAAVLLMALVVAGCGGPDATPAATSAPSSPATTEPPPVPPQYVALGDSFSSGEGLAPYLAGSDTETDTCHRSDQAYPSLVSPAPTTFVACSGATTTTFLASTMVGQEPPQVTALTPEVGLVTLSLGGNDLGWSSLLLACSDWRTTEQNTVLFSDAPGCAEKLAAVPGKIRAMKTNLTRTYRTILTEAPNAQIRVLNYPPLFPERPSGAGACELTRLQVPTSTGMVVVSLPADVERQFVALQKSANAAIAGAVAVAAAEPSGERLRLVDVVAQFGGYQGHTTTCGDPGRPEPWINSVRISGSQLVAMTGAVILGESGKSPSAAAEAYTGAFHPTGEGQRQVYRALVAQVPAPWR